MQTYKLSFKDDPDIPEFKRLAFELVEVDIKDVLVKGIHPWSQQYTYRPLVEGFTHRLNIDEFKIPQLTEMKYCEKVQSYIRNNYFREYSHFEELLERVNNSVRFVDDLTYQRLLIIAKEQLSKKWNHKIVKQIVHQLYYNFNDIRSFIKAKDKSVKLASYDDLDNYDLSDILSLEDFETEDQLIISHGLPVQNFRKMDFLKSVTTQDGLLKLTDTIDDFELLPAGSQYGKFKLLYRCHVKGDELKLIPNMNDDETIRVKALDIAQEWRTDNGNYCFKTSFDKLREMISETFQISFPQLDYINKKEPYLSNAMIQPDNIPTFAIDKYLTIRNSGEQIKTLLRQFGKPMTGNKEQLLVKLSELAAEQYQIKEDEVRQFFEESQFIKAQTGYMKNYHQFPILAEHGMRNIILTMYLLKHLRGNTIIDASYENDSYDLLSLAKSLVKEEISLKSQFLQVQY